MLLLQHSPHKPHLCGKSSVRQEVEGDEPDKEDAPYGSKGYGDDELRCPSFGHDQALIPRRWQRRLVYRDVEYDHVFGEEG
jgi:hypothetical protein